MDRKLDNLPSVKFTYQREGKTFSKCLESLPVQACGNAEIQPHLLRFETINLLDELIAEYKGNFEAAKTKVLNKIAELESWNLNDEMSEGILQNLKEQITTAMTKPKYMEKWGEHQFR